MYEKWKETQTDWDDSEFLREKANRLMKKRWKRLNMIIASFIEKEVIQRNEYISLLDIGAGRGDFYKFVENFVKKYTGIEPSKSMHKDDIIEDDFELVTGKAEDIKSAEEYDVCLLKEMLDHCYDPEKVAGNAYRALKPGGSVIISLTNEKAYYKLIFKKWAEKIRGSHHDHLYYFTPEEVEGMLLKSGFTDVKTMSINYLRMPGFMEEAAGAFPEKIVFALLGAADFIGRALLRGMGGSFIVRAKKESGGV